MIKSNYPIKNLIRFKLTLNFMQIHPNFFLKLTLNLNLHYLLYLHPLMGQLNF